MKIVRLTVVLLILCSSAPSFAQSLRFGVSGGQQGAIQLALLDQPLAGGRADLGVHYGTNFGMALHLRNTATFGPIGNLVVDLDASGTIHGGYAASLAARGTAGPVALRLRGLVAAGSPVPELRPADPAFPSLPAPGDSPAWGMQLGATYRLNRNLQLLADPTLLGGGGLALLLPLEAQLSRAWDGHDVRLSLAGLIPLTEAGPDAWGAAGLGLRINRSRAASWNARLLLGYGAGGFSPGVEIEVQEDLGAAGNFGASLRLEPYRADLPALQLDLAWENEPYGLPLRVWLSARAPAPGLEAGLSLDYPL